MAIRSIAAGFTAEQYVGPEVCALCHKEIAATQTKTAMAHTWQTLKTPRLPAQFHAGISEGPEPPLVTEIRRAGDRFLYSTTLPGQPQTTLPVEAIIGGSRHAFGFLSRIDQLNGIPLARPALIQARYAWSVRQERLVLAPGCPVEKPRSYETAFGLVLDPVYEQKCLSCHGQPNTLGAGKEGGVHCESCHGPGRQHLQGVSKGTLHTGVINPKRLGAEESIAVCAQCHLPAGKLSDPTPDDTGLLVANQVTALRSSECFIQSGKSISCTTCHDPHKDTAEDAATSIKACLGCHSDAAKPRASICPVNPKDACLGCHMPQIEMGPFRLVDHLIRVHPEQNVTVPNGHARLESQIRPVREFLSIIVTTNQQSAEKAVQRIQKGEAFSKVARDVSSNTAQTGGYLGPKWLSELDPAIANVAAELRYGQTSRVFNAGERWVILQRAGRDFKWQAEQLQHQAEALALGGDLRGALEKCQQALFIYPQYLHSLIFMANLLGQTGNPQRAVEVLRVATAVYPDDGGSKLALALMLDKEGHRTEAMEIYRRAISLENDLVPAYVYLGNALYLNEDLQAAIETFRQGLQINPLSAGLYYGLSVALKRHGDAAGAQQALALATQIDPGLISRKH
ncbi:MAG: tetratricopeptide repeat protein [Acidobacteriaceae bacterium]|nr:tetratricopeptide repeat protein [Acidobacteriaceae bacterium]